MNYFLAGLILTLVVGGVAVVLEMFLAGVAGGMEILALFK